jgi:N-methylhydantoinase A
VNVRLSARAKLHTFEDKPAVDSKIDEPQVRDTRLVYYDTDAPVESRIYDSAEMRPGQRITGPAVLEQMDTTTPVYPGDVAEMTPDGHLIITIKPEDVA